MKNAKIKKALAAGLSVALVAGLAVAGTVSYLESTSDDVVNTFSTNNVNVKLEENTGNSYDIIPGTSETKDPTVTVNASLPAWVYVEVIDETQELVTYKINEEWTKLEGYDNVYYRVFTPSEDDEGNLVTTAEYGVLEGNQVSYAASLTNADMLDEDGNPKTDIKLTFKAYAIQKEGFETPEAGWLQIPTEVSSGEDLNTALKTGGNIVLAEDMTAQEWTEYDENNEPYTYTFINVNSPSSIDLNGHTLTADWINLDADVTIENGTLVAAEETLCVLEDGKTVTLKDVELVAVEGVDTITLSSNNCGNVTYVLENVETSADIYPYSANLIINSGVYSGDVNDPAEINGGTFTGDIVVEQTEINDGEINGTITTGGNDFTLTINGGSFNKASLIDKMTYGTGDVVINGGTFAITNLLDSKITTSLGNVTISGGTFTNDLTVNTTYMGVINISDGDFQDVSFTGTAYSPITISGGTFGDFSVSDGAKAKLKITGGTFGSDPSAYVTEDYKAIDNNDGTWTVVAAENE